MALVPIEPVHYQLKQRVNFKYQPIFSKSSIKPIDNVGALFTQSGYLFLEKLRFLTIRSGF